MFFIAKSYTITFILILSGMTTYSYAQTLYNGDQTIYIGPNAVISVNGSVTNNGTLENNGEVLVTGDWENNNTYIPGEGALVLTGNNQQVNHNGAVHELVIDGTGEMLFTSDVAISGSLFLENGFLTPAPGVRVTAQPGATVSEGYTRSFVNGPFYHQGSGVKLFPVGKNGTYSPVVVDLGESPVIGFEVFESNQSSYFSFELRDVFRTRYWQQTLVSGRVGEGASITLPLEWYRDEDVERDEIVIVAAGSNANYQPLPTIGANGFVNSGTITASLNDQFSIFTMGRLAERPEERTIYVPNAFAPDHALAGQNGEDDRIKVYGKEISEEGFLFRIYNRWGVLVYETTSYLEASTKGWDGSSGHTGKKESMGSYKYMLKGKYNSGRLIEKSGSIHLIR